MDEATLSGFEGRLKDRLGRESRIAKDLVTSIEEKLGEVDWTMRVDQEDEGEDGSLFGDDGGDGGDEEGEGIKESKSEDPAGGAKEQEDGAAPAPNPREGWTIQDYVKYMETGKPPPPQT